MGPVPLRHGSHGIAQSRRHPVLIKLDGMPKRFPLSGHVRICHRIHEIASKPSHFVDRLQWARASQNSASFYQNLYTTTYNVYRQLKRSGFARQDVDFPALAIEQGLDNVAARP